MSAEFRDIELQIPEELSGFRLDVALARMLPEHSRTRIKGWIEAGGVRIGRLPCKPRDVVTTGSRVHVRVAAEPPSAGVLPETIPLNIVHEDRDVLVIDKPVGLVVHPERATRVIPCRMHCWDGIPDSPRSRAPASSTGSDKDTSGLLMVARTPEAHTALTRELMARTVSREYLAVCVGLMTSGGYHRSTHWAAPQ